MAPRKTIDESPEFTPPSSGPHTQSQDMRGVLEALQDGVHKRMKKKQGDAIKHIETRSKKLQIRTDQLRHQQELECQNTFEEFLTDETRRARRITVLEYESTKKQTELRKLMKSFVKTMRQEMETTEKQDRCILHQIDRLQEHEASMIQKALSTRVHQLT